jgi:hypothetical protein
MRVENKIIDYTLNFSDRELLVIIECLKNSAMKCYSARDKSLAIDLLGELKELFPDEDSEQNDDDYVDGYLQEIRDYIQMKYNIFPEIVDGWLVKLREMIDDDPEFALHFNAEYWVDFLVEIARERRNVIMAQAIKDNEVVDDRMKLFQEDSMVTMKTKWKIYESEHNLILKNMTTGEEVFIYTDEFEIEIEANSRIGVKLIDLDGNKVVELFS